MYQLKDVTLDYHAGQKNAFRALEQINLTISQGERLSLIGPSGCGKSTLLHLLAGLLSPTTGTIDYQGERLKGCQPDIGVILQEYGLFPWKTVEQNIALPLLLQKKNKKTVQHKVESLLIQLGLEQQRKKYPWQLSGGQRQRVAIARALVTQPQVLLMDEPFSALDALTRENLQNLVLELWKERQLTMVMVTHNIEEAIFLGQRIITFADCSGKISRIDDNGYSGQTTYRNTVEFYQHCSMLRSWIGGERHEA